MIIPLHDSDSEQWALVNYVTFNVLFSVVYSLPSNPCLLMLFTFVCCLDFKG